MVSIQHRGGEDVVAGSKGQSACAKAFVDAVGKGGESPIPLAEMLEVARVTLELEGNL